MTALILKWSDFFHSYQTTYLDRYQSSVYTYEVTGWFSMYYRGFITMNFIMRFWLLQIFPTTKSRIRQGPSLTLFLPGEGRISPYMSVTWPSRLGIGLKKQSMLIFLPSVFPPVSLDPYDLPHLKWQTVGNSNIVFLFVCFKGKLSLLPDQRVGILKLFIFITSYPRDRPSSRDYTRSLERPKPRRSDR